MPIQKTKQKNLRKSPQFPHGDNLPSWAGQSCFTCHRQLATDNWSLTPSQPRWLYQCHRQIASYRQLVFNTQSAMMAISVSQTDTDNWSLTPSQPWWLYQCHRQIDTDNWSLTPSQPWRLYQCHRQIDTDSWSLTPSQPWWLYQGETHFCQNTMHAKKIHMLKTTT